MQEVNAFARPGGKIGVYSGLLKVAKNQDQLATVIGHELTHVLAQHSNERLSRDQLTGIGLAVADAAIGSSQGGGATMAALGLGVQVGIALPYGRTQESEADRLGLELMARAGFKVSESALLYGMVGYANGKASVDYTDTAFPADNFSESATAGGVRFGVGGEYAFNQHFYGKAEYRYTSYSKEELVPGVDAGFNRNQVVFAAGYRF